MTIDDTRRQWLRSAYMDRITEAAMHYAATRSYFIGSDFLEFIADDFAYLTELTAEDQQYLRDQVGLESLRLVALSRAKDREEFFGNVVAENPDVVTTDAEFAFDLGWLDLLQSAVERVRRYPDAWNTKIVGGKEKCGCLVLHVDCDYSVRGCRSEVERLREEIRLRSLATCEICGELGRLRIGQWAKTACDKHAAVLGDFREDDGKWSDPWKWHEDSDEYPPEAAEILKDLVPVRPRPKDHLVDFMPQTAIARQIDRDIEKNYGRKADLLLEFCGQIEIAVVAAMSVADDDVDFWMRSEIDRWQGVQPLSDEDREFLHRYMRSLAIDERGRRQRLEDGAKALENFLADNPALGQEADQFKGRERELLDAYAGDLADSARGSVVKVEFLNGYIRDEIALWPHMLELSEGDKEWLRAWLRKMIDAEYRRIKGKD
ncbi:hypothetical protein [Rhizobium sp. NXC24]|uniref:hypothetical protein n=1 Tax=Rhizobium sp. NXC24 TaxID=2048897 RepID=UPI000CDF3D2D|nr:hypothetical protein [Rhizobium sp. NXC24]AVA21952.1 hypothetical protein NXC24_CH02315 [Rhizobium sp. NXC24]